VEKASRRTNWDLIIVNGGICNLTRRTSGRQGTSLEYKTSRLEETSQAIDQLINSPGDKVHLCTITPVSLHKYASHLNTREGDTDIDLEQQNLLDDIEALNELIKSKNIRRDFPTINLAANVNTNKLKKQGNRKKRITKFCDTHPKISRSSGPDISQIWPQLLSTTSVQGYLKVKAHLMSLTQRAGTSKGSNLPSVGEVQEARASGTKPTKVVGVGGALGLPQEARVSGGKLGSPSLLPLENHTLFALYIITQLLLLASNIEQNPGPRSPKNLCQICVKAVTWKQRGLACDECDNWYHVECMHMSTPVYLALNNVSWHCTNCGMPNFTTNLFETTVISNTNNFSLLSSNSLEDIQLSPGSPQQS
jgi:hypothetical protein